MEASAAVLEEVWLLPPLAIARVGGSPVPCDSYMWGPNDVRPRGTGKTTIVPTETLDVAEDGTVTSRTPTEIAFRDADGIRPVCPFFELHGRWRANGEEAEGAITADLLQRAGIALDAVAWTVEVANLKAFHYTLKDGDRVAATATIRGDDTTRTPLLAASPAGSEKPLVSAERPIPLGSVQVTRAAGDFPELRLRFTPAPGHVYGPTDLLERSDEFPLPPDRLVADPAAHWPHFAISDDARTNPSGLFAQDAEGRSLGLVDDVCDGWVACSVPGLPPARARVASGPPTFAPDRRPFVSLADGFADRVKREEVSDPAYVEDIDATTQEIRDLMERVWETMGLVNVDFQNQRARSENRGVAQGLGLPPEAGADKAFSQPEAVAGRPLPLTEMGRLQHRRLLTLEVFEDMLREQPDLINRVVRPPGTADPFYDRRMPALFRGSDRHPMHVTRRQYDLLKAWAERLRRDAEESS